MALSIHSNVSIFAFALSFLLDTLDQGSLLDDSTYFSSIGKESKHYVN